MKKISILVACLVISLAGFAQQEKELPTKIEKATVFFNGAQLTRTGSIALKKGRNELKIVDLSPYIDQKSIQVKGADKFKILSVRHQSNYMKELQNTQKVKDLEAKIESLKIQIEDIEVEDDGLNARKKFLLENQKVVSTNQGISPAHLKEMTAYYAAEMQQISKGFLTNERRTQKLEKEKRKLQMQLSSIRSKSHLPSSEIILTVGAEIAQTGKFEISYLVNRASWFPTYDVRFTNLQKSLEIVHKANIQQNTGVAWDKVKIKLSNANPSKSGMLGVLQPKYLSFPSAITIVDDDEEIEEEIEVEGIEQALQEKVAGVQVQRQKAMPIRIRGNSSLKQQQQLYIVDGIVQNSNPNLKSDQIESIEILKGNNASAIYGSRAQNGAIVIVTKKQLRTKSSLLKNVSNDTQIEFEIASPYNIPSDGKSIAVDMKTDEVPASYIYKAIPKLEQEAFLIAQIPDWEKVGLLSGDMNLYVTNTYVGKSKLDVKAVSDTLNISIGREKNIIVKREKQNDFNSSQFIGSKRKEQRSWEISVRNLKNKTISVELFDQIPVSTEKAIDIEVIEISNAQHNAVTGELKWTIELKPQETKKFIVRYEVKYPKNKTVVLD